MSDASDFKPNSQRARAAHDDFVKRTEAAFPSTEQASIFPVSHSLQARVSKSKETSDTLKHHMIRPKSPTRRYDGMLKDKTHFTYALMESSTADHEIETIFNVQNHELVCAVGSKTLITDNLNKVVASLEFSYFWCNFCPFTTNSKSLLTQHVLEHRFCCKYCDYESFCRSDIVRHMHKMHSDFKNTATNLFYITLLCDYLRVKSNKHEKENKDPDGDFSSLNKENIDNPMLDFEGSKLKSVLEKGECVTKPQSLDRGAENEVLKSSVDILLEKPETFRQCDSSNHHESPSENNYDILYMKVEDITDKSKQCASFSNNTSAVNCDTHSQMRMIHVGPHMQDSLLQVSSATSNINSSGICNSSHPYDLHKTTFCEGGKSNLYWSCGYCAFQSSGQNEISDHCSELHPGKPHRYVAPTENIASISFMDTNKKGSVPKPSTATKRCINKNQPRVNHLNSNVDCLFMDSSDSKLDKAVGSNNVTPSLSENGASDSLPKVRMNASAFSKKGRAVLKCFHCLYTSRKYWIMKNHIYHKHRGSGLVAVTIGPPCVQIFFCAQEDCTFHCEDASLYLNHVDQCIPWNKPNLADVEVEPHIREGLDQTIALAEESKAKGYERRKSRQSEDSCNTTPEDTAESIHSMQLSLKGKSLVKTNPLWIPSLPPAIHNRVKRPMVKVVKKTVDSSKVFFSNTSKNASNHLCAENLKSSVEMDHSSISLFPKVLPSEDLLGVPLSLDSQKADVPNVCSSPDQMYLNKPSSDICPSDNSNNFTSDNFIDVKVSKVTCLSEHCSELGEMIKHSELDLVEPLTDSVVTRNRDRADDLSLNEESLSHKVLTIDDRKSVLTTEDNEPELEIMQRKYNNDHPMSSVIKCKETSGAVILDQKYTVKKVNNNKSKLKGFLCEKTEIPLIKSSADDERDKLDNPSLKLKFKRVRHASVYNLNTKAQLLETSDTNENTRASGFIVCDSSKHSSCCNEEDNIGRHNDCAEASQIQNPWIKDLIDSTEESDSDQTFDSTVYNALNLASDRDTNSPEYISDNRNSLFVCNTFMSNETSNNIQEQTSLCAEDNSNQCIVPSQVLTEESETIGNVPQQYYSFLPLRSAAVKAISKMMPALTCETDNKDYDSKNNCRGKKSAVKRKLLCPNQIHSTNQKSLSSKKCKLLTSHKFASKMSKSVYMCQYCIEISEGSLDKIKSHVLSKHSSMPPVVINSFNQRHHINCQFYICPYDSCYQLSGTQKESETHKCTHRKDKKQQSSPELFETNLPISADINLTKKASNTKPVRACRVKLNVLDTSQINSVGSVLILPEKKKYQCLYCTSYYYDETLQEMKAHYFQEHEGQLIVIRDTEAHQLQLPSRIYVCDNPNCQQFYINRTDLDNHANSHKSNSTFIYECASCGWYSASHTVACHHVKKEHADEAAVSLVHMQVSVDEYGQTSKIIL